LKQTVFYRHYLEYLYSHRILLTEVW